MQPNHPQQGYGAPQQPYGEPERVRANAGAAALAGILGILAAGALIWTVVEWIIGSEGTDLGDWPGELWTIVIVRAVLALLILVLALLTLARKIGAAWTLFLAGLLGAATIVLEPLVLEVPMSLWFEQLFEFGDRMSIGIVAAAGLSLLAAIFALLAGAMKSGGQTQSNGF